MMAALMNWFSAAGQGQTGRRSVMLAVMLVLAAMLLSMASGPVAAQITNIDPNSAIDADLAPPGGTAEVPADPVIAPVPGADPYNESAGNESGGGYDAGATYPPPAPVTPPATTTDPASASYQQDDVLGAAEGVFGRGAEGLAGIIEKILKDQGEPNAYIAGREAGGAFVVGLRYGSGTLNHKIEGQRSVHWTGPSVGFDVGGNASKVFVLVYNLYDSQDLYKRYPAVEGTAYVIGGFTATYLRRGNVVLIPIRLGVGWRLGVNAGYMKFTEKSRILPF